MAAGRALTDADRENAQPVVVINETMAARYWPDESALGKRFHLGTLDRPWMTVVGIVRDVRHNALVEEPRAEMYVPHAQWHLQAGSGARSMALVARTAGDPVALAGGVRAAVRAIDPNLPVAAVRTLDAVMGKALSQPRFTASLLVTFAVLALTLAAVGIYGMLSLVVSERSREIGIRLALGARGRSILGLVLGRSLALSSMGIVAGLGAGAIAAPLLESLLYEVRPLDPLTFAAVPVVLLLVAAAGSAAPAVRASRVDPLWIIRDRP
jgi:predicted lysophospholipase L1 biosynthesis ABC-type transport system permease subunit